MLPSLSLQEIRANSVMKEEPTERKYLTYDLLPLSRQLQMDGLNHRASNGRAKKGRGVMVYELAHVDQCVVTWASIR